MLSLVFFYLSLVASSYIHYLAKASYYGKDSCALSFTFISLWKCT
ncbi:hypothetical protein GLYMA_18G286550v4 [Glycine max]|nr:hypothetical protein GLYMA_18G286550v4 [Glycine max]KAH1156606.1 hypothetical protein GYH30_051414 [Glycine max]